MLYLGAHALAASRMFLQPAAGILASFMAFPLVVCTKLEDLYAFVPLVGDRIGKESIRYRLADSRHVPCSN